MCCALEITPFGNYRSIQVYLLYRLQESTVALGVGRTYGYIKECRYILSLVIYLISNIIAYLLFGLLQFFTRLIT